MQKIADVYKRDENLKQFIQLQNDLQVRRRQEFSGPGTELENMAKQGLPNLTRPC